MLTQTAMFLFQLNLILELIITKRSLIDGFDNHVGQLAPSPSPRSFILAMLGESGFGLLLNHLT